MKNNKRIIIRVSSDFLDLLKGLDNKSKFIRDAVLEKLKKIKKAS